MLHHLVRDYLARHHSEQIALEAARYREQHPQLLAADAWQYIAMRDGQLLDHDSDISALHQRVRAQYGNAPILITPVTPEALQEFRIRRARLNEADARRLR